MLDDGEIWLRTPLSRCPHCGELLGDNPYHAPTSPWFCSVEHYIAWRDAPDQRMGEWVCIDCGYETNERWLMCPECSTPEDYAEVRAALDVRPGSEVAEIRKPLDVV